MDVYFLLSCNKCKWWKKSTGTTADLQGLVEHKACANCHGQRKFKCPKCANIVKMLRVNTASKNDDIQKKEPGTNS